MDAISGTDPLKDNLPLLKAEPLDDTPEVMIEEWGENVPFQCKLCC